MPRKQIPNIVIRTYHVTEPVGVFDKAKVAYWDECRRLEREGVPHRADAITSTVIEGVV